MKHFPLSLSVFFPAYNDAPSLPGLLANTFRVLREHAVDFEVIVVNDGSFDNTATVLAELEQAYAPKLRVVTHPQNRGYGGAIRTGLASATKDFIFYTDGDAQYDVNEIPKLLCRVTPAVGLVNGFKIQRHDPWHRIWIGATYNQFARLLFGVRLRDIDCDFRLIRRSILEKIDLVSTSGTVCVELVRKIEQTGTQVVEVPVSHFARQHGKSQFFRIKSLFKTFRELSALYNRIVLQPWLRGNGGRVAGTDAIDS